MDYIIGDDGRYPRRYCLGLIEAATHPEKSDMMKHGIRGVIASASLKPRGLTPLTARLGRYPRRYCLGLIEASPRSPWYASAPSGYPRRYCLGLIEAGAVRLGAGARAWYPRRYCLGLIEAVSH